MKERIIALLSAILIALSFTMPVHATAITADQVGMLYDLLGSMGIIAVAGGSHEDKYSVLTEMSLAQHADFIAISNGLLEQGNITTTDTGTREFHFYPDADLGRVRNLLSDFYTASTDYISTAVTPGIIPFPLPSGITHSTAVTGSKYDCIPVSTLICFDGSSYNILEYDGDATVTTTIYNLDGVFQSSHDTVATKPSNKKFAYSVSAFNAYGYPYMMYEGVTNSTYTPAWLLVVTAEGVIDYGDTTYRDAFGGSDVGDNFDKEALIPADVWAGGFTDSLARGQDVVLRLPDSLAGYDHVSDVYAPDRGLVDNVDIPGYVDAELGYTHTGTGEGELTEDLAGVVSGIGSLGNKLSAILSKLAALPALIGAALIGTGSLDLSGFRDLDLTTVFPFCIPFDLYNCFSGFNAAPVEPKFTVNFAGSALTEAGSVELDLTKFEVVFQIVRYFTFASFVVGLILVTRQLVRG